MKLLYDARMVDPAQMHGIARYIYQLVLWGLRHRPQDRIAVLSCRPEAWDELRRDYPQLEVQAVSSRPFQVGEQWELARAVAAVGPDLVHFPSLAAPLVCPAPFVITVHDLIPWHFPSSRLHRPYLATLARWSCARARRVITISHYSARETEALLGVPPARISVILHGGALQVGEPQAHAQASERPYVLCVTNPRPHKNLQVLLKAYPRLAENWDLRVVCAPTPELERLERDFPGRVRRCSGISDAQLVALYRGAAALVVPSFYEGFGLPALEGMQLGVPVVSADTTSLPEVVGETGLYFDPRDAAELVRQLERLRNHPELARELSSRGRERARSFRWESSALRHWQLYEALSARSRSARTIISTS